MTTKPLTTDRAPGSALVRTALVAAAAVAAAAHVPVIGPHLQEAPYMGVLFVLFTAGCAGLAVLAAVRPSRAVFLSAAALCGAGVVTYAATRLVAFPQLGDDVGNWLEPLGVVSVLSELVVAACGTWLALAAPAPVARSAS